jgi:hypothetical protein
MMRRMRRSGWARRLLQRVFGTKAEGESLPVPLADLAADPRDVDALAAVRLAVRKALAADPRRVEPAAGIMPGGCGCPTYWWG